MSASGILRITISPLKVQFHTHKSRVVDQIFLSEIFFMISDSIHYEKYNGSCFMYLSEILSKLHMFKVTHFMTFSDSLLM